MKDSKQGAWYLLTGLLLGLGIGLLVAWVISPVSYDDTSPNTMQDDYKDIYRSLAAQVYQVSGNYARAESRILLLQDDDAIAALAAQAQRLIAQPGGEAEARALAVLAAALQRGAGGLVQITPPEEASATQTLPTLIAPTTIQPTYTLEAMHTPSPSATSLPTFTAVPSPTQLPDFALRSQETLCDAGLQPMLQVFVYDRDGSPVPFVKITVRWLGGEDSFFTGLKPDISTGYADFAMTAEVVYSLQLGNSSETVQALTAPQCKTDEGQNFWGSLIITFQTP